MHQQALVNEPAGDSQGSGTLASSMIKQKESEGSVSGTKGIILPPSNIAAPSSPLKRSIERSQSCYLPQAEPIAKRAFPRCTFDC
jgi:hypothetical protein